MPMVARFAFALAFLLAAGSASWSQDQEPELLTVAEKSNFQATSTHAEVIEYCQALAKTCPCVKYSEFGVTVEGRKLPLLSIAQPPVSTPDEAVRTGKAIVLAFANIHAGEVDGKEGVLMLARELATAKDHPLFKEVIFLVAPNYNADGNDRINTKNRPGQNGPSAGMGIRENAGGFDLNRDFVKLETPEAQALVGLLDRWNPHIIIDLHTTNGSQHRHVITYDTCKHPACDARVLKLAHDKMMPEVTKRLDQKGGWKSFYYGNFNRDRTEWVTYGHQPRFSTQYCALRNRLGILSESYSYAPYKDRVMASKDFVHVILEYAAAHKDEVRKTLNEVARDEAQGKRESPVALRARLVAMPGRYTILGYEMKEEDGKRVRVDKEYAVTYIGAAESVLNVTRPRGYLIPARFEKAAEKLQQHGIAVEVLGEECQVAVEVSTVTKLTREREFQKHRPLRVEAATKKEARKVPAGTYLVKTGQPLGTLAAFLLEPQAEDGLTLWNFFDEGIEEGKEHPVLRALELPAGLKTGPVQKK